MQKKKEQGATFMSCAFFNTFLDSWCWEVNIEVCAASVVDLVSVLDKKNQLSVCVQLFDFSQLCDSLKSKLNIVKNHNSTF